MFKKVLVLNCDRQFWMSSIFYKVKRSQCYQISSDCLAATSVLVKKRCLGETYLVFGLISTLPLPIPSPWVHFQWTKLRRVACNRQTNKHEATYHLPYCLSNLMKISHSRSGSSKLTLRARWKALRTVNTSEKSLEERNTAVQVIQM